MSQEAENVQIISNSEANPVLVSYRDRISELRIQLATEQSIRIHALIGTIACLSLMVVLIAAAIIHVGLPTIVSVLPLLCSLALYRRYVRSGRRWKRIVQETNYLENGIDRLTAAWQGTGETGQQYAREKHLYQSDLNVIGEGSLFELLCTTRSAVGAGRLAAYLLDPVEQDESRRRQEAVKELSSYSHLREEMYRLGDYRSDDCKSGIFDKWFSMSPLVVTPFLRLLLMLSSSTCVLLVLCIFAKIVLWSQWMPLLSLLIFFQMCVAGLLLRKTRPRLHQLRLLTNSFTVLHGGLSLLERQNFQSSKLQELVQRVRSQNASTRVRKIEWLARLLDQRDKHEFYFLSLLLAVGTQLILAMDSWRAACQNDFPGWVDAWAEFEALQAIAGYAFEQPGCIFPELIESGPVFEAEQLGHPLIEASRCVRNGVAFNDHSRFYLVTGSNMAGKSTFLRAIGLNAVIALAGGPVRANSARLSQLKICASLVLLQS